MPKLDWIGKNAVVHHHMEVPYRLVHCDGQISAGDADAGNLLVQGDNLEALKSLLPYYAGKVKCIYIDPPYNTGNEGWEYNDKVNSLQIRKWLHKVVGKDDDDLCRHDKWLCMMYPRMRLLREFLREDGVIFVSIDDNEQHRLRLLMDEIFGGNNFVNTIIWQRASGGGNAKGIVTGHDYVLVYQKHKNPVINFKGDAVMRFPASKTIEKDGNIFFVDDDVVRKVFGPYQRGIERRCYYEDLSEYKKPAQVDKIQKKIDSGEYILLLQKNGKHFIGELIEKGSRKKMYSIIQGVLNNAGKDDMENAGVSFPYPKPVLLIKKLLASCCEKDSIIMDSFAGSGTTAHAVLQQNKEDGGNRRFVLIEMEQEIAKNVAAKRIQRAIEGYETDKNVTEPLGGGFHFCTLGKPLFDETGNIAADVTFFDLAAHVFFSETGAPIRNRPTDALLGVFSGRAIYLLFNGIMGDKHLQSGNVLTSRVLRDLPPHPKKDGIRVIFGEACFLSDESMRHENIEFRQVPYDIRSR